MQEEGRSGNGNANTLSECEHPIRTIRPDSTCSGYKVKLVQVKHLSVPNLLSDYVTSSIVLYTVSNCHIMETCTYDTPPKINIYILQIEKVEHADK